jgi:RHS repeat-associated protein
VDYVWLNGRLIGRIAGSTVDAIHTDQTGRPQVVTDSNQAVVWKATNYPFEREVAQDDIGGLNLGFPGQYYDAERGLWNNGYRDYNASLGRYVESDPSGLNGGVNTYVYAENNPLSYMDPSGFICISDNAAKVIGATAGGAVTGALTGMAIGKNGWAALAGGLAGGVFGAATQALSNWLSSLQPGHDAVISGVASSVTSVVQEKGNVGIAVANGAISYVGEKMGYKDTPGIQMTSRVATYVGAATLANRELGAGAFVAGPMFGVAGAYTDMAAEAAAKLYSNNCDCQK